MLKIVSKIKNPQATHFRNLIATTMKKDTTEIVIKENVGIKLLMYKIIFIQPS